MPSVAENCNGIGCKRGIEIPMDWQLDRRPNLQVAGKIGTSRWFCQAHKGQVETKEGSARSRGQGKIDGYGGKEKEGLPIQKKT